MFPVHSEVVGTHHNWLKEVLEVNSIAEPDAGLF